MNEMDEISDSRILPALVVDSIFVSAGLVLGICSPNF